MKKATASMPQGLAGANAAYCQRMAELRRKASSAGWNRAVVWPTTARLATCPRWRR